MGKIIFFIWGGEDLIKVYNSKEKEIGYTTDREDYHDELKKIVWSLDTNGYIVNKKVGSLHKYIMQKWYGEDIVAEFYKKGFIIEHMNNRHNDDRISNLAFYLHARNVAKGNYFDKEAKRIEDELLVLMFKDFNTECYQIALVFNDNFFTYNKNDEVVQVYALYLLYDREVSYNTIVNEATDIITMYQEKSEIDLSNSRYCDYRLYDEKVDSIFGLDIKKDDIEDDVSLSFPFEDISFKMVPQEEKWEPTENKNRLWCELIIRIKDELA